MSDRDKNIYFARLAEQGERYEDMIRYMKEVVKVSYSPILYPSISWISFELLTESLFFVSGRTTFK